MYKFMEKIFSKTIFFLSVLSVSLLSIIFIFIFKESLEAVNYTSLKNFLFGTDWAPLSNAPSLSIATFFMSTLYVSLIAMLISVPIGIAISAVISVLLPDKISRILNALINILAGIPSVVYGFIGLCVLVKFFEVKFYFSTGESVLCASIVLSIMILPYIVSIVSESMRKIYENYSTYSKALGISKWYMMNNLILPSCINAIVAACILALGRAMGETMAVMMVIGNSPLMPSLFSKAETIPSLIALEMGSAKIGSAHYHGLYAAGFVLLIVLLLINSLFYKIKSKIY